ncbi:hypothetical protein QQ020_24975 [Fulvivirgaceae bacterium BMA12]|uniref:Uncharacterized protein n=1 Tax=Agaribacillus aureus TaxID=3051825 RepID=A0ABT8LEG1_9BACT|nr:hypothetical protein [Fulvivirgaceae bacterium BMA12]
MLLNHNPTAKPSFVSSHLGVESKIKKENKRAYDFVYVLLFVLEQEQGI